MARSLINQFTQTRGSRTYDDELASAYAELTGRVKTDGLTYTVAGTAVTITAGGSFEESDVGNYVTISGAAYQITSYVMASSVTVASAPGDGSGLDGEIRYIKNLEDDLNYIRTQLKDITGAGNWNDTPAATLSGLNDSVSNMTTDFLSLTDTYVDSYSANNMLYTSSSGVHDTSSLTFRPGVYTDPDGVDYADGGIIITSGTRFVHEGLIYSESSPGDADDYSAVTLGGLSYEGGGRHQLIVWNTPSDPSDGGIEMHTGADAWRVDLNQSELHLGGNQSATPGISVFRVGDYITIGSTDFGIDVTTSGLGFFTNANPDPDTHVDDILESMNDAINASSTDKQLATAKLIYDHINTVSGVLQTGITGTDSFLELNDTYVSSYSANNMLYTSSSGVHDTADMTYDSATGDIRMGADGGARVMVDADTKTTIHGDDNTYVTVSGGSAGFVDDGTLRMSVTDAGLALQYGARVDEILDSNDTLDSSSADDQLATAKLIYDHVAAVSGTITTSDTFIGLEDTISSYNADRVLFETATTVSDSANFTYDPDTGDFYAGDGSDHFIKLNSGTGHAEMRLASDHYMQLEVAEGEEMLNIKAGTQQLRLDDSGQWARLWADAGVGGEYAWVTAGMKEGPASNRHQVAVKIDAVDELIVTNSGIYLSDQLVNVDTIVTSVTSDDDTHLITEGAAYDMKTDLESQIATVSGSLQSDVIWEIVDTPTTQIRPKIEHLSKAIYTEGNVTIGGDLTVTGTTFFSNTEHVNVSDNIMHINYGEAGAGVQAGEAGIQIDRGSEIDYQFLFDEGTDTFRIGVSGTQESFNSAELQPVATREDTPGDMRVPWWQAANNTFRTHGDTYVTVNSGTDTINFYANNNLEMTIDDGGMSLATGPDVNEILDSNDTISAASTDDQLLTAKLLYNTVSGILAGTPNNMYYVDSNGDIANTSQMTFTPGLYEAAADYGYRMSVVSGTYFDAGNMLFVNALNEGYGVVQIGGVEDEQVGDLGSVSYLQVEVDMTDESGNAIRLAHPSLTNDWGIDIEYDRISIGEHTATTTSEIILFNGNGGSDVGIALNAGSNQGELYVTTSGIQLNRENVANSTVFVDTILSVADGDDIDGASTDKQLATAKLIYNELQAIATGSGTVDHANLNNLDYASSGHTGFSPAHSHPYASDTHNHAHNDLTGKQGGAADEYYHLDAATYSGIFSNSPTLGIGEYGGTNIEVDYGSDTIGMQIGGADALTIDAAGVAFAAGTKVNEILDSTDALDGTSTDDQLASAKLVYESIATASGGGTAHTHWDQDCTFSGSDVWTLTHSSIDGSVPDYLQVFLNGIKNKDHADYYTASAAGNKLTIAFAYSTTSDQWCNVTYIST